MKKAFFATGLAIVLGLGLVACKKEPPAPATPPAPAPISVKGITLGKAVGPDKRVSAAASSFARTDTIYASVETAGSGNATLKAKWTFHKGDKVAAVNENTQTLAATGPAVTEFHISKPDGWPVGSYQVEVFLNDASAGVQKFSVQ